MTKELSIENIKKELVDALVGDMRIITSFANKEKKSTDYIGTNIFNYLDNSVDNICHIDTYINFDVIKSGNKYNVIIQLKAHRDIANRNNKSANCLDEISKYIEENVNELYPYNKSYSDVPENCVNRHLRRKIRFTLCEEDVIKYQKSLDDDNNRIGESGEDIALKLREGLVRFTLWQMAATNYLDMIRGLEKSMDDLKDLDSVVINININK